MHLKWLEIQGFKSFATRTRFEMASGITAVVGPNGSGKSNVADAIRWVLGEQSGKHLRTKKLEDVIFAGSSGRSSVGMAEVSMALDNEERWLPIDFNEVVVTRRAYRSGESEYLINASRVRLRDVVELFMRANLGQNSYAILGQGAVDTVLNLRPDERRSLIEEAAGVRHYRLRLDEARDRLRATRENLDRVTLLLDEIRPRLAHLEKQAKRAGEHQRLTQELSQALRTWYGQAWHKTQDILAGSRAAYDQRRGDYNSAQAELDAAEAKATKLRAELDKVRSRVSALEKERQELLAEINRLDQTVTFDEERVELMKQRRDELAKEVEGLQAECAAAEGQEIGSGRLGQLTKALKTARKEFADRQAELSGVEQEFVSLRGLIVELQERSSRARSGERDIDRQLQRLKEAETRLKKDLRRMTDRREALSLDLRAVAGDFRRLKAADAEVVEQLEEATQQHRAVQRMVAEAREAMVESDHRLQDVIHHLSDRQSRFDVLSELQNERLGLSAEVRQLLAGAIQESGEVGGQTAFGTILGVVGRLLRVPAGLERAIEASLGDNLQTVVMASQEDALNAVRILTEREAGRLSIIPLDVLKTGYALNLHNERGVVGVAARLVKCDQRYRSLFDTLLGRTVVVENLDIARRMIGRGLGSVVTLDGIMLRPYGEITGGAVPHDTSTFSWEGQLQELPAEIDTLTGRRSELEKELHARRDVSAANESAATTLSQRIERLRSQRSGIQDELAQVRNRVGQIRGEISWIVISEKNSTHELEGLAAEREDLKAERARLQEEGHAADSSVEDQQKGNAAVLARREELIQLVAEASREVAASEGEKRSLDAIKGSNHRTVERLRGQIEARETNSAELVKQAAAIGRRLEQNRAALAAARERLQAVEVELGPGREEVIKIDEADRAEQETVSRKRAALMITERECLEAESQVQRRADELSNLRNMLEADGMAVTRAGEIVPLGTDDTYENWSARERPRRTAGNLPPMAGAAEVDAEALKSRIHKLRQDVRALGPVNFEAQTDYSESRERYEFLTAQVKDMQDAEKSLLTAIDELEDNIEKSFQETFGRVNSSFTANFKSFFGGGNAQLVMTPGEKGQAGVDIMAQVPGRRLTSLTVLSGGERALTATALLFSLLEANPAPFCVLDEVDAALDESNVERFTSSVKKLGEKTQFIMITHNRRTIESAGTIYGLSMGDDHSSRVLSLRLSEIPEN
ncbi:MAG: chromosome segregation protein SMC [Dehalococcoidia bacterium]